MTNTRNYLKKLYYFISLQSLRASSREQGLSELIFKLEKTIPDISDQYSTLKIDTEYLKTKVRNMHAFQMSLVSEVMKDFSSLKIVDIGDSAGTHLKYIMGLYTENNNIEVLSVNMDPEAARKIKAKGLRVLNARAEDLARHNVKADIFLCFETLEHLNDPCNFLYQISSKSNAKYLIITVPYLKKSRVGLHHIRGADKDIINAENTHIFELCPEDWKLLMKHSGWDVAKEKIYLQYPKRGFLNITKPIWRKFDYEGFYGLILKRDNMWSSKYSDWQK